MGNFSNYIMDAVTTGLQNPDSGIPIPLSKLSKYTNYIQKGKLTAIGGRPTSGKTSFMDYIYMINVYKWWRELPENSRPKLKMFYFSNKTRPKLKFQKWLCLYLKLEHSYIMDIPTLTTGVGRSFDLDEETIDDISSAREFFDDLEEDVLEIIGGKQTPTSIKNRVEAYMHKIGKTDADGNYNLKSKYADQYTMVYIENDDYLMSENDNYKMLGPEALKELLNDHLVELKNKYKVNSFVVTAPKLGNSRSKKDTEPTYKDLNSYSKTADLGLVMYNPFNENNNTYLGYPVKDFVINQKNRMRTVTIVRNTEGVENITAGLIFLGECGYLTQAPSPIEEEEIQEKIEALREI